MTYQNCSCIAKQLSRWFICFISVIVLWNSNSNSQTVTLIDPAGDGGFENGSTFAANGWTLAAGVATNQWFVGNAAAPFAGSNCAYISDNGFGTTYSYNVTSASTVYFYRDIAFPATKTRITMVINWKNVGEAFVDRPFVCYTDPANTPVVNDFMSSTPPQYATSVTGNYNSWGISTSNGASYSSMTVLLPASFAGTTKRIIFGWQNDAQNGSGQPGAFDNISLTAEPPITCTPTVNGGLWSDAASWTGGLYPGTGDDVLIPDGTSITVDGSQVVRNFTVGGGVSGYVNFIGSAFNNLTVTGNITVNNGGQFNGFSQSASPTGGGIQLNVAGNINLNAGGTMTLGHASTVLVLNGTASQSINGPGVFLGGMIRVLSIANPTSVTLNIPVTVTEAFRHYAGTLNTNGNLTIDNTVQSYNNAYNQQVYTVNVSAMGVGYTSQPTVTIAAPSGAGTQATAVANWDATSQKVRSITITNPGSGYRANPAVTFSGATFTTAATATAIVLQSIQGGASFLTIKNGGTTINGGITTINNGQGVNGISITNTTANNIGYVSAPTVGFALPVRTFLCPTQGSGYTTATVSFTYPSGTVTTAATATALIVNGKVTSINITAGGVYVGGNGTVNVVITGANTTPASGPTLNIPVATAIVNNGMVAGFNITNTGSDYVTAPTITLAGGTPTAAAAAPSCRIGLYNLQYSISSAPTGVAAPAGYTIANVAAVEGPEMPANRKLFTLAITNPKHLTLNDNLELTAASSAINTSNGIISFSGANKTITCSNPAYAGAQSSTSATLPGFINGIVTLTTPGGTATRTFPVGRSVQIVTGTGTGAFGPAGGSDITSMTAQTDVAPTGTFTAGTYSFTGIRTYNVIKNGTQFGTNPTAQVFWGVEDNLASDNAALHVAQATATSGPWTVRSIAGAAGLLGPSGGKATATGAPGPITYNANDYFTFATNYTPPPGLNYVITRTTGNTYNSIAATGSSIPSWQGSTSTETQISNAVSLAGTTFQYQGAAVTGFRLGIDGYFTFNTAFSSNISTVQLGPSAFPITSALAAFWGNLGCNPNDFTAATRDASIKYKIDGTLGSGSAIITVEWIHMTGSQNPVQNTGSDLNFQIKLYENGNKIEYNYGLMQGFDGSSQTSWSYACGMNGSFMQSFTAPGQLLALQEHDENTTNFSYEKAQVGNAGTNILHTLPACYSSYIFTPGVQVPYVPGSIIPANDEPAGAVVLTELASPPSDYCGAKYTSYGATPSAQLVCTGNADDDVWFKFTATDPSTAVKVVSSGGYDAAVQVFDASLNLLSPTVCKDTSNDGRVEIAKISGLTISNDYYVRVYHKLGGTQATATATVVDGSISTVTVTNPGSGYALPSSGSNGTPRVRVSGGGGNNGVLLAQTSGTNAAPGGITGITISSIGTGYTSAPTITIDPPSAGLSGDFAIVVYSNSPPPSNDGICGPAIPLTVGVATCNPTAGTTFGATQSGGIPTCLGVADDDVFYSFVAPVSGNPVSVQVQGSASFDAVVQILSSNNNLCSGTLANVACMNSSLAGGLETITTTSLVAGNTYFVRVYHASAGAGSGTFTICVFESGPPCPDQTVPPNGSLAYIGGTTLKWIVSAGATGYDVYFSSVQADVINGAGAALVSSNQAGLTYATGAITNGTVYYWRVNARNAVGASVGCTVRSFTGTTDIIIGSDATVCSGNFYDSGGPSGIYQNNENSTTTICPATVGTASSVTFTSFGTSLLLNDAFSIYNGPTIASPQFAGSPFLGFPGPTGNTYTSTDNSGCITFRFTSDNDNNTGQGWGATVNCVITCTASPTSPVNGGNLCAVANNTLSWPSNPGATGYDVYLDNSPNPTTLVVNNQNVLTYNTGALAAGTYYWKVVNRAGAVVCANPTIWSFIVRDLPTPDAFSNSPVCEGTALTLFGNNLTSGQGTGNTYSWSGPNSYTSSVQNPVISGSSPLNTGTYNLTVTNQYGCTSAAPASTNATVNSNPVLSIASQTNVSCTGLFDGSVNIDASSGTAPYLFDLNGNSTTDGIYTGLGAGSYSVTMIDDNSCEAAPINFTITVLSSAPPSGSAGTPVPSSLSACSGTVLLVNTSTINGTDVHYSWNTGSNSGTVLFSTNIGGPFSAPPFQTTSPMVYAQFGTVAGSSGYNVCVQGVNGCGSTNNKCVWIRGTVSVPGTITPANPVACPNDLKSYACGASGGATVYNWTLGGSTLPVTSGQGTTNVQVTFPPAFTSAQLCVTAALACGGSSTSAPRCMTISKNPATPAAFTAGPAKVCPGATGVLFTIPAVTGATGYNWTAPAGCTITSGQNTPSIQVSFPNPYTGAPPVCVSAISACGTSTARCKTVGSNIPTQPGSVTGPTTNICNSTVQYSISNVAGASGYTWTNPAGTTITSGQGSTTILLSVSSSFNTGSLTVVATTSLCAPGSSIPRTISIFGKPNTPANITPGPATWCNGGFVNFSAPIVTPAVNYNWSVSNGTITAGQGSNNIDVTWGTGTGNVTVNATNTCGASSNRVQTFSSVCREEGDELTGNGQLTVYPNPAHDKVTVSVMIKEAAKLNLSLRDVSGRVILSEDHEAAAGLNNFDLNLKNFAKGIYNMEVQSASESLKSRIIIE